MALTPEAPTVDLDGSIEETPGTALPEDTDNSHDMKCPWCLKEISDSWEYTRNQLYQGKIDCPYCDKPFKWEAEYSVDFHCEALIAEPVTEGPK